ncbi:hypothetical protein [Nitrosarchaeum koreense]|nr:hypothetical protein [Nitrosarchaeum koreense]
MVLLHLTHLRVSIIIFWIKTTLEIGCNVPKRPELENLGVVF